MRARLTLRTDGVGWGAWLAIAVCVVLILGAVGLAIYGGTLEPPQRHFE